MLLRRIVIAPRRLSMCLFPLLAVVAQSGCRGRDTGSSAGAVPSSISPETTAHASAPTGSALPVTRRADSVPPPSASGAPAPSAASSAGQSEIVVEDAQDLMIKGGRALTAAGVRSRYFPLPGAAHGYMGDDPEGTFERVFAFLYETP